MSNSIVPAVYRAIIDQVTESVKQDFIDLGYDETVLHELQQTWENKLAQARVANFQPWNRESENYSSTSYFEDQNNNQSYSQNSQSMYSRPTTNISLTSHPYGAAATLATLATSSSMPPIAGGHLGRPQPYLPPASNQNQTTVNAPVNSYSLPTLLPTSNNSQAASSISKKIPQTDGTDDLSTREVDAILERRLMEAKKGSGLLVQLDGEEDKEGNPSVDEAEINSDLDDESDEDGAEENTDHIILCQYEKVTRAKNKWKCTLRDGIMHVNGKDYLFQKANGDFEW